MKKTTSAKKSSKKKLGSLLGRPYKDKSGSISVGGTAQIVSPVNPERNTFEFQNTSDTEMRIDFGVPATAATGFKIKPDLFYLANQGSVSTDAIYVFCAVGGKTYTAKET